MQLGLHLNTLYTESLSSTLFPLGIHRALREFYFALLNSIGSTVVCMILDDLHSSAIKGMLSTRKCLQSRCIAAF